MGCKSCQGHHEGSIDCAGQHNTVVKQRLKKQISTTVFKRVTVQQTRTSTQQVSTSMTFYEFQMSLKITIRHKLQKKTSVINKWQQGNTYRSIGPKKAEKGFIRLLLNTGKNQKAGQNNLNFNSINHLHVIQPAGITFYFVS
jgi:hypothetical protein